MIKLLRKDAKMQSCVYFALILSLGIGKTLALLMGRSLFTWCARMFCGFVGSEETDACSYRTTPSRLCPLAPSR
jgi:hypothetical protein